MANTTPPQASIFVTRPVQDIERAIRDFIIATMPPDTSGELATLSLAILLIEWFNWRDRNPHWHPRSTQLSAELLANPLYAAKRIVIDEIVDDLESGQDLSPRLSERAQVAHTPLTKRTRLNRRADLDLLLADWGIHHLHLDEWGPDGRTGALKFDEDELLYLVIRQTDAFLVDVKTHGDFNNVDLAEIIVTNWPNQGIARRVRGVLPGATATPSWSRDLRYVGVAQFVVADGAYHLFRGETTGGVAIDVTQRSNRVMWKLREWDDSIANNANHLFECFRGVGYTGQSDERLTATGLLTF